MLEMLSGFIIQFIAAGGYGGIFLLMLIGSSIFPIPSEVILPFSGYLVHLGKLNFFIIVLLATLADVLGSLVPYFIGYFLEEKFIINIIKKHGKYVLLSEREYERAAHWFEKYGDKMVFVGKLLPGVRWIIALPAGVFEMPIWKFLTYAFAGALLWSAGVTYLGVYLGNKWQTFGDYFRKLELVIVVLLVVVVLWYLDHKLELRKKIFKK